MWPKRVAKTVIASMRIFDIGFLLWGKKIPCPKGDMGAVGGENPPFYML